MMIVFKKKYDTAMFFFKIKTILKEIRAVLIHNITPEIPQKGFSYLRI